MLRKKMFMLGAFAVGKTSLVSRYVHGLFSERYLTTVGVKVDKKVVVVDGQEMTLLVWDLHGEDEFQRVKPSYLRGSSGCFVVADGTRPETVRSVPAMLEWLRGIVGEIPCLLLLNKHDLHEEWAIDADERRLLEGTGLTAFPTSAKTGEGVQEAFEELARRMLASGGTGR